MTALTEPETHAAAQASTLAYRPGGPMWELMVCDLLGAFVAYQRAHRQPWPGPGRERRLERLQRLVEMAEKNAAAER